MHEFCKTRPINCSYSVTFFGVSLVAYSQQWPWLGCAFWNEDIQAKLPNLEWIHKITYMWTSNVFFSVRTFIHQLCSLSNIFGYGLAKSMFSAPLESLMYCLSNAVCNFYFFIFYFYLDSTHTYVRMHARTHTTHTYKHTKTHTHI